jgi:hypothetical protein
MESVSVAVDGTILKFAIKTTNANVMEFFRGYRLFEKESDDLVLVCNGIAILSDDYVLDPNFTYPLTEKSLFGK